MALLQNTKPKMTQLKNPAVKKFSGKFEFL